LPSKLDYDKITRARLSANTPGVADFKCRDSDMIDFIQHDALNDQIRHVGTTWTWIYEHKELAGFVTLAMFSLDKKVMPKDKKPKYPYSTIPSLLVGQLATHYDFEGNGLAREMIKFAVYLGHEASQDYGCRTVALHPLPNVVSWYEEKTAFKLIRRENEMNIMYFDLMPNPTYN